MRLGLLGDVHGDTRWTLYALERLNSYDVDHVVQLGDFGIWPDNFTTFIKPVVDKLEALEMVLWVVPGNHEDYDQIEQYAATSGGWISDRLRLTERGERGTFGDLSYVMLGGAPSPDREYRQWYQSVHRKQIWWPQEQITDEDVARVEEGGRADLMFGHDAPFVPQIEQRISSNPMGFSQKDLAYCLEGRRRFARAAKAVMPKLLFHGHYHFPVGQTINWPSVGIREPGELATRDIIGSTRVVGLSQAYTHDSFAYLDTNTLEVHTPTHQIRGFRESRYSRG